MEFLAGAVVPPGQIENKKIFDVYRVIKGIHGTAAPVIFKEVLSRCAKNDKYVKQLDQFCDDFEASQEDFSHKLEELRRKLTFREEFLNKIEEPGHLSFFVCEFTDDELGCRPAEIKSSAILFRQLFRRETIVYDGNNQEIEDRLSKVQRMVKTSTPVKTEQAILFHQLFRRETIVYDGNNQEIEDRLSKVQRMVKTSTPAKTEQGRGIM